MDIRARCAVVAAVASLAACSGGGGEPVVGPVDATEEGAACTGTGCPADPGPESPWTFDLGVPDPGADPAGDPAGDAAPGCKTNDDCLDGQKCLKDVCVFKCATDPECLAHPGFAKCDPATGACVGCAVDRDCTLGSICVGQACVPGCRATADCLPPDVCDPDAPPNGVCGECVGVGGCAGGKVCVDHHCVVDCSKVSCAGDKPKCNPPTGECVECLAKADCQAGNVCVGNACISGCEGDGDCASGFHCKVGGAGTCVECFLKEHCAAGKQCVADHCSSGCQTEQDCAAAGLHCKVDPGGLGQCVECITKYQCGTGRVCSGFACVKGCEADYDCVGSHCDPTGTGTCVECVTDAHCAGGKCVSGTCLASPGCKADGDCGTGSYCHPLLLKCLALPSGACPAKACGGFLNPDVCDPLTRLCIPGCASMGTIGCMLLGGSRPWCDDAVGGCYECLADGDCPGTACSKLDRTCVVCATDADCAVAGSHCDTSDGGCHECVYDYHCGTGLRCNDSHQCVECLTSADCKSPSNPKCDASGTCCHDECSTSGQETCETQGSDNYIRCEANGGCLQWTAYACPPGQICTGSKCVCDNKCSSGQKSCSVSDATLIYTCTQNYNSQCWYWQTGYCPSNQKCYENGTSAYCY